MWYSPAAASVPPPPKPLTLILAAKLCQTRSPWSRRVRIACVRLSSWRLTRFPLLWREAVIHSAARPLVCTAAGAAGSNPAPSASSRLHHEVKQPPYLSTWRSPPTLTRPSSSPPQPRVHNFRLLPSLRGEATASKYNNATCFLLPSAIKTEILQFLLV